MRRAPRVLVSGVVLGQPMGGVIRHNQELLPRVARLLAENGGSMSVLEGRRPVAFDLPAPIERIRSDVPARPVLARAWSESRALRRALRDASAQGRPFDLVHTAHLPAPRDLDVPFTITIHDLRSQSPTEALVLRRLTGRWMIRDAARRARRVFTVSRSVAGEIGALVPQSSSKLRVVPNAADHFTPLPRRPAPDAPIVCLGHLEKRKNLEILLRALALDPTLPNVELHGAAKGVEEERLRAVCMSLGVTDRVRFAGPFAEADLPAILAGAACVCLPSTVEGFGIVALEAQRARVPLAIARAGALPEVVGNDVPAFEPDDPRECASALRAALALGADPSRQPELDSAAIRSSLYTWDRSANSWFHELCAVV